MVSIHVQVVPLRVRDELLEEALGGVGLLKLGPRLGLAAGGGTDSGTDSNVSEPREGLGARFTTEVERI